VAPGPGTNLLTSGGFGIAKGADTHHVQQAVLLFSSALGLMGVIRRKVS
jgi:hypothetical protein